MLAVALPDSAQRLVLQALAALLLVLAGLTLALQIGSGDRVAPGQMAPLTHDR